MIELKLDPRPVKDHCNGLIFRGQVGTYQTPRGDYIQTIRMLFLKRKSCPGCDKCGFLWDDLAERVGQDSAPDVSHVEHGVLYRLETTNQSRDWETGVIDDWDLEFIKIEELRDDD